MDAYTDELVMKHLRQHGIVDKICKRIFDQMCGKCHRNYYCYEMDAEDAVKDAVGTVLLENGMEISGYKIRVA